MDRTKNEVKVRENKTHISIVYRHGIEKILVPTRVHHYNSLCFRNRTYLFKLRSHSGF